ncbi:vacuolar protein sorting-associated protein 13D, partial [Clonorchis sinensis]
MLRKVIAGLIERVIGSYVEDVNGEKLSIGLLNGTIGRVSVHIPYTHIWSQPWQLCIEDVELIAYPSASELYNRQTRAMQSSADYQPIDSTQAPTDTSSFDQKYYLAQMEEKWWKTIHSTGVNDATALAAAVAMGSDADASSWLSYLASFGYAVVRSIQIEIHNVHLRIVQHASPTDLLIMPESLFGAFTISLEHLTVKTTDVGNQETNAECKLIKMDNFCVKWSEVVGQGIDRPPSSTTDMQLADDKLLYVLPPSSLTGQLKRSRIHESASPGSSPQLIVDRSVRNRLVQLEFDTGLGDLKLQLSRDLCKASVHLAELVSLEQHRMEQFARRPKVPVRLNATKWWKYIAGEVRPQLRPLFNSTLRINLVELAAEARSNLLYVDAYTNYLVRGLTTLYQPSSAKQPVGSMESDCSLQSESDVADHFRRRVADEQWPVGRIAALRLVAMRRAASVLHEFVKPQRLKQSAGGSSHSGSPLSSPCPIEGGNHHQQEQLEQQRTSVSASPGAMSWYAWWRYSSLLGIRTLWYGPEATESIKPSLSQSDEIGSSRSRTAADSPPTVKQAIFELLDELALSSDPLGEAKSPGCVPEGDLIAFRLICRVVGCSVRLVENDFQFSPAPNSVHPAFISVCGESMQFTVEAEPWQRSLRFAASVESFMVRDERHLMVSTNSTNLGHSQSRPTFPFVVFPRVSKVDSSVSRFPPDKAVELTQSSGLLWLVYEVRPPGSTFDYSLKIKTDPLHVVYQPELIHCVVDFLQTVASAASLDLESSARLHYEVIKQRTQANIRAILDETSKPNGFNDTILVPRSEPGSSPSTGSFQPAVKNKRPRRWHLQLDISAPRLLLPNRFSEVIEGGDVRRQPVIGLLCNFGHLRVSNWPIAETATDTRDQRAKDWVPEDRATASAWSAKDEDDLFLTPCGTPDNQSDAELDDVDAEPRTVFGSGQSDGATSYPAFPQVNLYQSFVVHLDELHVLVGPLNMLKKLQLWTNPEDSCFPSDKGNEQFLFFRAWVCNAILHISFRLATDSHTPTDCTDFEQEVLSPTSSRLLQQLSIVDRISLRLLVSRRVITYSELVRRYKTLADQAGEYPPSLWITLEQERCVLQLSDSKINNLLNCLRPKHEVPRQCTTEINQFARSTSPSAAHSGRPEGLSWSSLSRSWTRSAVTPRPDQSLNDRRTCLSFSTQRKRLIATFSVAELIVQLENKGYPTAEFRLEGFAGTWIRLTGRGAGYQGRIQLRNFSIADAVTNLGGEYDLLLAAHKDVRLNDYGQLEVRSTCSVTPSETFVDPVQSAIHPLVQPPEGHVSPILEFSDHQDSDSHFIRLYFDWIPRAVARDVDSHVTPKSRIAGTRTVRLHLHCLDVVYLCSRKMSFRLNGLRVLDLTQNSLRYRYLLTAGIVSKSVGTSSASVTDRSNSAVFLNLRWPTSDADHTELSLFLPHFTYVHSSSTIEQLISWTQTLPTWRIDAKVFPPPASSEMSHHLFSVSGCCEIVQPVLVIPDGTASSSRALIVRLQNVHLLNPDCPSLCPNRLTTCAGNRMCTRFDSAEMLFVEFAKFPALHISSPVLAERMLRFYRSVTCPSSSRQSSGAEHILAPISGCLWLSSPISGFHLPRWYSSFTVRPSDLFSDSPPESVDPSFSSNQPSSSANSLELFLLEVKVERAVRIYLTKPVCLHLSRFLLSVSSLRTQFGDTCGSLEPPSSDSPKSRISLCLSLPHLQLDTMADLDIYPVPLACLKLNDLVVKLAQASNTTPHLSSCGELFARDLVLCDVLPVENGSTPNVDPILFSVLPENAESAALSKTTSNITASCPDLTSNWDRGSKIHTASVGSCSHAISDDQLATCQACSAYDTFAHSLQLFHTAALRIQLLMLSNLIDSGVPEKFSQAKRMIRVQCKQVFSRLRPQPWVLLLDFLSFSSPDGSSFDTRLQSSLIASTHCFVVDLSEQILPTNAGTTASTISKPTLISISADAFEVVLTTTSCDDPTPCDLAKFSGHTARLCLVDLVDQLEPYLPVDRQFTPDNFPGPYLFMEGGLGDLVINTQAPTSPMFLLDIVLSDPRFVVPVSSCSPEALVVVMDRLMVKTSCLCTHDEVDFVSPIDESRRYRPHCFQRLPVSDPLFQYPVDAEIGNCVLERIHLDLSNAMIYHGVHCSMAGHVEPEPMASSPIVPSDTLVQCLHFSDYLVTPGQQPNRLRHTLFDSKSMQFRLERNLHSARSHHVPDWRLVTPLTDVQIYLNEHIYSVVRGILSHNFGDAGARKDKTEPSAATSLLDRFKLPQLCDLRHPSYYPPKAGLQTAITGIPWTVFSFEIPMENVRFLCFDDANGSSGSGEHSRIDFRLACFSFDALSDRRVFVELRCAKVRFIDPQINKAIIAPLDPLLHDGLQSRGSRPNLMTSPVVHCFWLQYIMDQGSAALWLHLDRMRILYHYNAFSRLLSFLKSPPSSKCSVDPPQSGSSQSSFAYQLCAENSELELVGPRDCAKSSAILLQPPRPPKLNMVCTTSTISVRVSPHIIRKLRSIARVIRRQMFEDDASHDDQIELFMPLEGNENTRRRPFTVATWIQRLDSLADWISPFVHDIKIQTGFSFRILRAELGYLVPLFDALLPRLTLTWCREETSPIGVLKADGLALNYFNRDLVAWEPALEPWRSLEELESRPWYHVGSAQEIVDIPSLTTQSEKSQDSSVLLLTNPPSLLFRVAGWKPTYPISVDRLGIYFRTLERNDFEEDIDEDKVFTLTDYLPQFTRLVIEVVRTGPSVQHVIVLRSGLTITNDLADGHQLLVGLQPPTAPLQSVPEDIWSSQLDDANLPIQRIPVCLIDSGDTAAVPLNLAAVLSRGFGVLSFCPTLIPIGPGRNMSSVFSQMVGPSFAAYGWAGVSLPGATPATQSETATGVVTSSSLPELSEIEAAKHLDWTNLKQPGELIETILVCRSSTATNQVGLLSATLDSAATSVSSSSTSAPISYHRTQSIPRQYNMCLAMVRDSFPPDPLWTGLLSTSNRANPKCLPGHHITVGPIVRITNLLPCDLVYYFSGTMVKGSISAGADACVNELSPAEVLRFGVHLDGFPKCEPLTIPPNTYDQKVLLRLQDTLGRPLELQIQVLARAGSAKHLTVSAAFWLINQSGLPLIFAQSSSSPGRLYASNSEAARQRALTNIASGQYDEHEEARSVSPLLFSFSNRNEGYLLRVRVGRGLSKTESADPANPNGGFSPVWSPAISLDKSGVDMLQLKMVDSTNRPSLVYHVGFEVREGCGRHAVTRIVTFKPRYVIENATDLRLHVAQQKCLRTRSGASAIAVLDSGGTQAYHWPREDLDRLLCVRAVWEVTNSEQGDEPIHSERHSSWSGGFPIDRPYSFTMMLHLPHLSEPINSSVPQDSISDTTSCPMVDRLFLRVVLVLRAATFHILLSDASSLPAPFRIENDSAVSLSYQQVLRATTSLKSVITDTSYEPASFSPILSDRTSASIRRQSGGSLEPVSSTDATGGQEKSEWLGGATLSYIGPATSVDYAVEEPLCNPVVALRVQASISEDNSTEEIARSKSHSMQTVFPPSRLFKTTLCFEKTSGGTSAAYDLDKIGLGRPLIYDNFVYLTVLGPLMDTAMSSRCDSFSSDFVFDVRPSSHHVVYSSK